MKIPRAVWATQTLACIVIPDFGIQVLRQAQPELVGAPVALVQYGKVKGKIMAVSNEMEMMGIVPGLAISRARPLCPTGHFITHDSESQEERIQTLLDGLWTFTNRVEIESSQLPQTLVAYLDLGRLSDEERDLVYDGMTAQLGKAGFAATVAFASGKLPAYIAALRGIDEVLAGEEAAFIADAPLDLLSPPNDIHQRLQRLYIRTLGEFAALPRAAVAGQFGREGVRLHQLASGMDGRPVKPRQMPATESRSSIPIMS